jgi:(3,5-dihydroxyphenyl)acetyl-CoA 1,2-dioxygenase
LRSSPRPPEELSSLVAAGLPEASVSSWNAVQPQVTDDFGRDLDRYVSYWEQTNRLLSALPAKSSRSNVERPAAQTLLSAGRESRERFLGAYTRQLYDSLTAQRSRFVRVERLVAAAADAFPGLVPSAEQLAAESKLKQVDKDGLEIDQGIFLSHVLAEPDPGIHLCHAMLLPRADTADLAAKFQALGKLDLGAARLERRGKAVLLTTANPSFLNAEDDTTIDNMELAVDVATLDAASGVAVLRGDLAHKGKYSGRPVFGAGINLSRLYQGKIPFLWFMTRELGYVHKLLRGIASPETVPDDLHGRGFEKPWIAALDTFAIGGHCQILLCMDYILASAGAKLTLPARKEGIIPGLANLRLPRFTGVRVARQAIQHGLELFCESAEGGLVCDKIVAANEMDLAIDRICEDVLSSGPAGFIANRRALRIGLEPLDTFRQYCSVYAREQAYCCFSTELISNLEQNWNARSRGTGRDIASGGQRSRLNQEEEGNE